MSQRLLFGTPDETPERKHIHARHDETAHPVGLHPQRYPQHGFHRRAQPCTPSPSRVLWPLASKLVPQHRLNRRADTKPEAKASTPYKDVGSKLRAAHDEVASLADKYEANASEPKANSRLHGASSVFDSLALADDITQAAAAGAAGGGPAADEEEALE